MIWMGVAWYLGCRYKINWLHISFLLFWHFVLGCPATIIEQLYMLPYWLYQLLGALQLNWCQIMSYRSLTGLKVRGWMAWRFIRITSNCHVCIVICHAIMKASVFKKPTRSCNFTTKVSYKKSWLKFFFWKNIFASEIFCCCWNRNISWECVNFNDSKLKWNVLFHSNCLLLFQLLHIVLIIVYIVVLNYWKVLFW